MRIRTVKPNFWSHPVMARQLEEVQLLALALLNYSDDEGYFFADPPLVRSALRPFDDESTKVRGILEQLEKCQWIEVCDHHSHGRIGRVVNFSKHQKIDRPKASAIKGYWNSAEGSSNDHRSVSEVSLPERNREQGKKEVSSNGSRQPSSSRISRMQIVDDAHILDMKTIYRARDVDKAVADLKAWLKTPKGAGKAFTKRRLQTFLRDAEPIPVQESGHSVMKGENHMVRESIDINAFAGFVAREHPQEVDSWTPTNAPDRVLNSFLKEGGR